MTVTTWYCRTGQTYYYKNTRKNTVLRRTLTVPGMPLPPAMQQAVLREFGARNTPQDQDRGRVIGPGASDLDPIIGLVRLFF